MKPKIQLLMAFVFLSAAIVISCKKTASIINKEKKTYSIVPGKLSALGVSNIIMEYDPDLKKALIKFAGTQKTALGLNINLNGVFVTAEFSDQKFLEKIDFNDETSTTFSIKNEMIRYAYKSSEIKNVSTESIRNTTLDLTPSEQLLALIYTSLYQDLQFFDQKESKKQDEPDPAKKIPDFQNSIDVGCYQIGGSKTSVEEHLKDCSKKGCTVVGTDVSCLWGSHACFGTVTYSCLPVNQAAISDWNDLPHLW